MEKIKALMPADFMVQAKFACLMVKNIGNRLSMDMVCIGTYGKGGPLHASAAKKLIHYLFKPFISFRLNK